MKYSVKCETYLTSVIIQEKLLDFNFYLDKQFKLKFKLKFKFC